jgi:hypothetical protein
MRLRKAFSRTTAVLAGLGPAIHEKRGATSYICGVPLGRFVTRWYWSGGCHNRVDGRDKPGHDEAWA